MPELPAIRNSSIKVLPTWAEELANPYRACLWASMPKRLRHIPSTISLWVGHLRPDWVWFSSTTCERQLDG